MNRYVAFLLALVLASITVSSACVAAPSDWIAFTLQPDRHDGNKLYASFRTDGDRHENNWSSGMAAGDLGGFDLAGFRANGSRPLHFTIVREAGRLDCSGSGGQSHAVGNCSFTADPGFTRLLASRGIGTPTRNQSFGLMAVNARREVIDAVAAAHYPTPSIDDLMGLSALGVNGAYINGMAQAGYRPRSIQSLIEFKALNITPEWIAGFVRVGYGNMPTDDLMQLKALNVTPEFISGYDRLGYRHLPVDQLVQLKALNVTPDFVRSNVAPGAALPPVNDLVEMKIFGGRRPR
jgi:hypothetical protein